MIQALERSGTFATLPMQSLILRPQIRTRNGFDKASLSELAESIKENGVMSPILVAPAPEAGMYYVIAGERRILASTMADLEEIPAMITDGTPARLSAKQAVENLQRENLHPLDIAEGLQAMEALYPKPKDLAKALGKSPAWLSKHKRLARLTPAVHEATANGLSDVETITTLDTLARIKTDKAQHLLKRCIREAEEGNLTRELARTCLANAKKPADPPTPTADNDEGEGGDDGQGELELSGDGKGPAAVLNLSAAELAWLVNELRECSTSEDAERATILAKLQAQVAE